MRAFCLCVLYVVCATSIRSQHKLQEKIRYADSISIPNGEKAIRICDSILMIKKLPENIEGIMYRIRGKAFYFRGKYEEAGRDFDQSVRLLSGKETNELGTTFIEQAKLYRKVKMYPQAIETYQRALDIFKKNNDDNNVATVLNEWGVVYEMMEDYPKAVRFYRESLELKEKLKDTLGIAYANSFLSNIYLLTNNLREAENYAQKALTLFRKLGDPFPVASVSADLSAVYIRKKDYHQAVKLLKYSSDIAQEMHNRDLLSQNYARMAEVYTLLSDYKTAFEYYRQSASLKDSLFLESSQQTIADLNVQYETSVKNQRIIEQQSHLSAQRWLLMFTGMLLIASTLLAFYIYRDKRLREAQLIKEAKYKEEIMRMEAENSLHEDRLRISRDLHDNIGSYLTYINSEINENQPAWEELKKTTNESIAELRRTVWLINKPSVSLEEWIVKLKEYHLKIRNVIIETDIINKDQILSAFQATGLFRIVQEAVNNALKYSNAQKIVIFVSEKNKKLLLEIRDDGKGFKPESVTHGFGLQNISDRARDMNGSCDVDSGDNKGVTITIQIPLENQTTET